MWHVSKYFFWIVDSLPDNVRNSDKCQRISSEAMLLTLDWSWNCSGILFGGSLHFLHRAQRARTTHAILCALGRISESKLHLQIFVHLQVQKLRHVDTIYIGIYMCILDHFGSFWIILGISFWGDGSRSWARTLGWGDSQSRWACRGRWCGTCSFEMFVEQFLYVLLCELGSGWLT